MLSRRLERLGHTVSSAASGREFIEMIRSRTHDLLLLDIVMPDLEGYAVQEYLQANPSAKSMRMIEQEKERADDLLHIILPINIAAELKTIGTAFLSAAHMQTEASPGTLCVAAQTWKWLEPHCDGVSLGAREIKGKGQHEVFEVQRVRK